MSPDSTIVQWNPGAAQMFGYASDEAEGQPLNTLLASSRSHERIATLWSEISQSQKSLRQRNRGSAVFYWQTGNRISRSSLSDCPR